LRAPIVVNLWEGNTQTPGSFQVSFGAGWKQAGAGWCAYALCRLNFGADGLAVEPLTLSSEKVSGQY